MTGHFAKKRFGQNFLVDALVIDQIINFISPLPTDHLVEIGPGLGSITLPLLPKVAELDAIELDRDLIPVLQKKAAGQGKLQIYQEDALNLNLKKLSSQQRSLRLVGNLPYNISTPLLFHLLKQKEYIIDMHFMLQREVGLRLSSMPETKQYGRLSVMAQYHCEIELLLDVPSHAFRPAPRVDSTFLRLTPQKRECEARDLAIFDQVVKAAFTQRRKTIHNSLAQLITKEQILELGIDPNKRPEDLSVDNFVIISNKVNI